VAVSTGLTIDYTIHLLNSIRTIRTRTSTGHSPSNSRGRILRYGHSLIRSGGLPVFLSFLTSIVAFSSLYLSSFSGAAHFGFLISVAIACAFFIGVFLLPLFFIPGGKISTRRHS
jgi:predicted RND superfamily exporter protein